MQSKSVVYPGYQRFFPRLRRNTEYFSVARAAARPKLRPANRRLDRSRKPKFSSIQGIQSITTFSITCNFLCYRHIKADSKRHPWLSAKSRLSNERRNYIMILTTRHYQDLDSAFYRIKESFNQSEALPKSV